VFTIVATFHILVAVFLILLVLIQDSKGGAGMFGGSSNTVMGATGAASFLVKLTRGVAIVFASTCIVLTIMSAKEGKSVIDDVIIPEKAKPSAESVNKGETKEATKKAPTQ